MAKINKNDELTIEEKLERALVPKEEWPYEVPENWCWVRLQGVCATTITDGTHKTPIYCDSAEGVPFISAKDITSGKIDWENIKYIIPELHKELYKRLAPQRDDILLAKNGTTGIAALVETDREFDVYVTIAVLRPNKKIICPQYMYYLVNSPLLKTQFDEHLTGIGVPNLHLRDIKACKIVVPTIQEQQRIVNRIETLFAKLNEVEEKVREVLDSFETRKATILHKAFTGELTKGWRIVHGQLNKNWIDGVLGDFADSQYGYTAKASNKPIGPKLLRITDIQNNQVVWDTVPYCEISDEDYESYKVNVNDIMVARTGATTGKSYLIEDSKYAVFASFLIRLVVNSDKLLPQYLHLFMQSQSYWEQITELSSGIAQPGVNSKKFRELQIPIPSVEEQNEINKICYDLIAKEEAIKKKMEMIIDEVEVTRKSILSRAFCGKLGTNNSEDENAYNLLKNIIA